MKTVTETAVIESAFGKVINPPINFEYSFDAFENVTEMRAANEFPKDSEVLDMVNTKRKGAALSAQRTLTLKANNIEKPTLENDPQEQLKTIYLGLRAAKKSHEEARATASAVTGIEWTSEFRK